MKKTTLFSLILIVVSSVLFSTYSLYAQTPAPSWSECLGGNDNDRGFSICHVGDVHSILICGLTTSTDLPRYPNPQSADGLVIKKDENGDTLFLNTYGGPGDDVITKGIELPGGDFIFVGSTSSSNLITYGPSDIWVFRTDSMGVTIWEYTYGGSGNDGALDVVYLNGKIYIAGETFSSDGIFSSSHGDREGFVLALDLSGTFISAKTYGGSGQDAINSITALSSGYLAFNGWSESSDGNIVSNHGLNSDMFIGKINTNLDLLWTRSVGSTGSETGYSIIELHGNIFAGGYGQLFIDGDVTQRFGYPDLFIAKMDTATPALLWFKPYGGSGWENGGKLKKSLSGDIFLCGASQSDDYQVLSSVNTQTFMCYDPWVALIDTAGTLQWETSFGNTGNDAVYDILPLDSNNFIALGISKAALNNSYSPYLGGGYDIVLQGTYLPYQPARQSMLMTNISDRPTIGTINVYPNPSSGMIRVTMPNTEIPLSTVIIYDISGQILFSKQTSDVVYTTELAQFAQGTYIVEVRNGTQLFRQRVQKM